MSNEREKLFNVAPATSVRSYRISDIAPADSIKSYKIFNIKYNNHSDNADCCIWSIIRSIKLCFCCTT